MSKWSVTFCCTRAEEEFLELPVDVQARLTRTVELFEVRGPAALMMPLARPVDGKLWELRASGRDSGQLTLTPQMRENYSRLL